jgi:hypothetical protein
VKRHDARQELRLAVDHGQTWPLSDIFWDERPNWESLLPETLRTELRAWAATFNDHFDWELGSFGSEDRRRAFDLEGVRLAEALDELVGDRFCIRLEL